ncbi:MBL fold metallo-hydrolase [Gracilibacillus oryzae]|nr:MBL fold metallo-hydrolase [Gracilibacillus oryzae]
MKLTTIGFWGAYPSKNEATSCYLLEEKGKKIVIDCGSGALAKLQNHIELTDLDAVIISHIHPDHIADLYCLEYAMLIQQQLGNRQKPLDVFIYTENVSHLPFSYPDIFQVKQIKEDSQLQIGTLSFSFHNNLHEIPCCAVKITDQAGKSFVYSGDTGYTESFVQFARNVDTLLIECSFFLEQKGLVKGHLSTVEVAEIAERADVKHVILTHFPHYGSIEQLVKEVQALSSKSVDYAKETLSITI